MLFRVSYSFVGANNRLASAALIVEAKDASEATRKAETQLKADMRGEFRLGAVKPWVSAP